MEIGCLKACNRSARPLVYGDDEGDMRTHSQLPIPARCCPYDQSGHLSFPPSRCPGRKCVSRHFACHGHAIG
jgi:hypothetical protein